MRRLCGFGDIYTEEQLIHALGEWSKLVDPLSMQRVRRELQVRHPLLTHCGQREPCCQIVTSRELYATRFLLIGSVLFLSQRTLPFVGEREVFSRSFGCSSLSYHFAFLYIRESC